ncbi:MAG: tyrosine-type recombinase/integrase [Patescibacteria group bacterium]|nr:tyrosine-type recombinase/integrase [Patescibacteria group bacterium]
MDRDELVSMHDLTSTAQQYVAHAKADNTLRAYQSDWRQFVAWCEDHSCASLPASPETVAVYLAAEADAGRRPSTLTRRISAISQAHQAAGHPTPTTDAPVAAVMAGIRRVHGTAPQAKAAATTADLRRMVETLPQGLLGIRDRALLLVGFAGALRRSELVGLDVIDVAIGDQGATITLRRSKTDQEGQGRLVGIPYGSHPSTCPVRALQAWLEAAQITAGPVFRSVNRHGQIQPGRLGDRAVALVVQRAASAAGLDATHYAGHSLRAGLATSAAAAGVEERVIMAQTGHRSVAMVRRYIREGSLWRDNAAGRVGL